MSQEDEGWKSRLSIPVNYSSCSEDEFDDGVVIRGTQRVPESSGYLLEDSGEGAPVDMLGTTPPRVRIRNKQKRNTDVVMSKTTRANRRNTVDSAFLENIHHSDPPERPKKRDSLKTVRGRQRDMKLDIGQGREHRADSLPSPTCYIPDSLVPHTPTVVDSRSRYMSLSSRLKCRGERRECPASESEQRDLPPGRVSFHRTFSMLIRMGNIDNCRRAPSVEEQVWQNRLKDLIWLELRARLSSRSMQQQDRMLCQQRQAIPSIINNIVNYRFINTSPCLLRSSNGDGYSSSDEVTLRRDNNAAKGLGPDEEHYQIFGCLNLDCEECSNAVGKALKEVGTLLDSFYSAETLYPSSKAMAAKHPLIATQLFNNRLKAMCLWYNIAHNLRLKVLGIRKLMKLLQWKAYNRQRCHQKSVLVPECSIPELGSESPRTPRVHFDLGSCEAGGSHNSDSSGEAPAVIGEVDRAPHAVKDDSDREPQTDEESKTSTAETMLSSESGYSSKRASVSSLDGVLDRCELYNVYQLGPMADLTRMKLLGNCDASPYRLHIADILKTQGLRKAFRFIHKIRQYILIRAYMTFEKYDSLKQPQYVQDEDPPETLENSNGQVDDEVAQRKQEEAKNAFELRRYGCWSEETLQMRLPSYRSAFLLLSTVCLEVVHDYLTMRLETLPEKPSVLTVKQLMHELKEGLDIATEQRATFVHNIDTALDGYDATGARAMFVRVVQLFDSTIDKVLTRYLSYLTAVSEVEHMSRALLEREWGFAAELARRTRRAALRAPPAFANIMCNQLNNVKKRFDDKFRRLEEKEAKLCEGGDESAKRHWVYEFCRLEQSIYVSERELTTQSAQFSRLLAWRIKKNNSMRDCVARIFDSMMLARNCIVFYINMTIKKTEAASLEDDCGYDLQSIVVRVREVLLQGYKLGFEFHKELHRFVQDPPGAGRGVCGRRPSSINVPARTGRPKLMRSDSAGVDGTGSGFQDVQCASIDFGVPEMLFEDEASSNPASIGSAVRDGPHEDQSEQTDGSTDKTDATDCASEVEREVKVVKAIIDFAKSWMRFVTERCDRGRGLRPRWASHGLEFLMLACDPCNTKHLTEVEFEELKSCMDGCISHVVGSRSPGVATPPAASTPTPPPQRRKPSFTQNAHQMQSARREVPTPPTPPTEPEPIADFHVDEFAHSRRAEAAIRRLEAAREERLSRQRAVGRVVQLSHVASEPRLRQVTFRWQRGLKIGAGNFGKVYTVVNTDSGQLLAMKEISIGYGDRRALQRAANELQVLEGIIHPHLVRYYGCEIHREEMLIFMELCVEGSLEALIAESGALPEPLVRRYTKQLVSAVAQLHERRIAHRDMKTGNIFLTNERHCLKLGDFGCAVKIRSNSTAVGELQGHVGTQAYMAPEVFMKSTGHGRAADIWSLGCVVTEMASGKRPFAEYEHNYQIMYAVGQGGRPEIPPSLSEEGRDLCLSCLQHDPELRPRATDLTQHNFLRITPEENCNCEPGRFIAK